MLFRSPKPQTPNPKPQTPNITSFKNLTLKEDDFAEAVHRAPQKDPVDPLEHGEGNHLLKVGWLPRGGEENLEKKLRLQQVS